MASFRIEKRYFKKGINHIAGVDEAGRGALFGPVVAAAVILPPQFFHSPRPKWVAEIDDSKALTAQKRKKLLPLILEHALAVGLGAATIREIDKLNVHQATLLAMSRAISYLSITPQLILIDGAFCHLDKILIPQVSFRGGDRLCKSIAAASIVAKVFRDDLMVRLDRVCKGYKLCENKGYGTKEHFEALQKLGPSPLHRRSFNLKIEARNELKRG